jgi:hypothetical protein
MLKYFNTKEEVDKWISENWDKTKPIVLNDREALSSDKRDSGAYSNEYKEKFGTHHKERYCLTI